MDWNAAGVFKLEYLNEENTKYTKITHLDGASITLKPECHIPSDSVLIDNWSEEECKIKHKYLKRLFVIDLFKEEGQDIAKPTEDECIPQHRRGSGGQRKADPLTTTGASVAATSGATSGITAPPPEGHGGAID